jgi:NADH dehydrogenase FAD-containing subunit
VGQLVIAVGSVTSWFGVHRRGRFARPFKTLVDATTLPRVSVGYFEMAEQARAPTSSAAGCCRS